MRYKYKRRINAADAIRAAVLAAMSWRRIPGRRACGCADSSERGVAAFETKIVTRRHVREELDVPFIADPEDEMRLWNGRDEEEE